ncbi:hypothetical protein [Streptomyces sp. NPDC059009]|uniref:hypothetical protein n=1 Tax=Streptomyces sp. NPDC059009 TaxID=3346694 RepID=UPI0036B5EBE9
MYVRRISPTERLYVARALATPPMAIQLVVEGTGSLDAAALTDAVAAASLNCPGARVVRRGRAWVDTGPEPAVRRVADAVDGRRFEHPALRAPFHASTGPNCEVLLAGRAADTVVFRAFHAVMDGQGVLTWAANVFAALRGEPGTPARSTVTETDVVDAFPPRSRQAPLPPDCASPLLRFPAVPQHPTNGLWLWRRRTIPGRHRALAAKVAAAVAALGADPCRFVIPVSLRRHGEGSGRHGEGPGGHGEGSGGRGGPLVSTANLTLPVYLDVPAGSPWPQVRDRLRDALAERRELGSGGLEPVIERVTDRTIAAGSAVASHGPLLPCTAVISNVGAVHPASLSAPGFTARTVYSLPMYVSYAPVFFTAYQLPGHVELSLSCADGPGTGARAEALLDHVHDSLLRREGT